MLTFREKHVGRLRSSWWPEWRLRSMKIWSFLLLFIPTLWCCGASLLCQYRLALHCLPPLPVSWSPGVCLCVWECACVCLWESASYCVCDFSMLCFLLCVCEREKRKSLAHSRVKVHVQRLPAPSCFAKHLLLILTPPPSPLLSPLILLLLLNTRCDTGMRAKGLSLTFVFNLLSFVNPASCNPLEFSSDHF